jgi:hypothetical protein
MRREDRPVSRSSRSGPAHRPPPTPDTVTQQFLALDDEQRETAGAVAAASELGLRPDLRAHWQAVAEHGEQATISYLAATDDESSSVRTPHNPAALIDRADRDITRAREGIRRFNIAHRDTLDSARAVMGAIPRLITEATEGLATARAALAASEAAGYQSARARALVSEAHELSRTLGAPARGLRERQAIARRVRQLAQAAQAAAEDAPNIPARARSGLASVTTRRAATAAKCGRIAETMSTLRREFTANCSTDLEPAATRADAALRRADRALEHARARAQAHAWEEVVDQLPIIRTALRQAEAEAESVVDRLADLRAVAADPQARVVPVRFQLRDARQFVVTRGQTDLFGPALDAQGRRLEAVHDLLKRAHPDYLRYINELQDIREGIANVISQARAAGR